MTAFEAFKTASSPAWRTTLEKLLLWVASIKFFEFGNLLFQSINLFRGKNVLIGSHNNF